MKPFIEGNKPPHGDRAFVNGKYQVIIEYRGDLTVMTVRREDRRPIMDWRDMQWIKNQLLGPEVEAVQLFPAESRLVDLANQFYFYAYPAGYRFPFGFPDRAVGENISLRTNSDASKQRPFAEHVRPPDLRSQEERIIKDLIRDGFKLETPQSKS